MGAPDGSVAVICVPVQTIEETWPSVILAIAKGAGGGTSWKISYPKGMEPLGTQYGYKRCKEVWVGPLTSVQYQGIVDSIPYFKDDLTHGTDCVGLARAILRRVGIDLPKESQWPSGPEPAQYLEAPNTSVPSALGALLKPVMSPVLGQ
jgi:hypothetical protein